MDGSVISGAGDIGCFQFCRGRLPQLSYENRSRRFIAPSLLWPCYPSLLGAWGRCDTASRGRRVIFLQLGLLGRFPLFSKDLELRRCLLSNLGLLRACRFQDGIEKVDFIVIQTSKLILQPSRLLECFLLRSYASRKAIVSDALGSRSEEALLPTFILLQDIVETFAVVLLARPRLGASALCNELLSFHPCVVWLDSSSISASRHEA